MKLNNTNMTPHQRILEAIRDSRKTLNVIAVFYIVVGFALALASSFSGDRLGAFLGFMIISGALAFTVLLKAVLRIGLRISNLAEHVDVIRTQMEDVEHLIENHAKQDAKLPAVQSAATQPTLSLDLTMLGKGDVSEITAAILDRSRFPRLVTTMDEKPPAQSQTKNTIDEKRHTSIDTAALVETKIEHSKGISIKNLLAKWKTALRDGDLATCRSIYSAMVDVTDPVELESLCAQMEQLADNIESKLRLRFSQGMQDHDFGDMLETGKQICELLPDRSIAQNFIKVKPLLLRKKQEYTPPTHSPQDHAPDKPVLKVAP